MTAHESEVVCNDSKLKRQWSGNDTKLWKTADENRLTRLIRPVWTLILEIGWYYLRKWGTFGYQIWLSVLAYLGEPANRSSFDMGLRWLYTTASIKWVYFWCAKELSEEFSRKFWQQQLTDVTYNVGEKLTRQFRWTWKRSVSLWHPSATSQRGREWYWTTLNNPWIFKTYESWRNRTERPGLTLN